MDAYDVEVAVGYPGGLWGSTFVTVESPSEDEAGEIAERKVLRELSVSKTTVSFVKTIWIDPGEEEEC